MDRRGVEPRDLGANPQAPPREGGPIVPSASGPRVIFCQKCLSSGRLFFYWSVGAVAFSSIFPLAVRTWAIPPKNEAIRSASHPLNSPISTFTDM